MEFNQKITKNIEVKCPICQTIKNIDVPETVLSQKEFGTVKIQIPIGAVCQHQFLVFLDPQGIVRSYEKIDVHMTVSKEETPKEAAGILTLKKLIQIFGLYGVFSLIHSKLFNYPSYIIVDENFEHSEDLLNLIGDQMLPERYQGEKTIHLLLESDYNRHLQIDDQALLMDTHQRSVQTPWEEKLRFEESMVKKALEIIDEEEQLFIIQNEILKFITEAETVKKVFENAEGISEKDLKKQLIRDLKIPKISSDRLKLLKEFIKRRIST
ncbi:MAG: hypothetical protein ACFE8A_01475 [Candidatus Hodarchaeota archaeon]